ncbi:polysaccharide biosynthesis protein [Rhodococcoides corynebacterioides]|uniref:Polysaccharide biosynthesis protein n=1 Tax=Rhodococcoides corynebacterioides TaxID=53972 RepID=A0ABS7P5T1_9NOCA|nr:polysaccharide biosynthesis protein [Rhodococcus corynebacterioides]MBY6367782.1 polysaccharide biosynthesis protein [Rhodococcus corynebacterioides]MBY6407229.1 polysaccharide biosynthesis protein [Rhodococcus corynebacterioides]
MIPARASAVAAGVSMVTAGSMLANVASYGLQLVAADLLGPAGYGEFGPLLAAQLVLAVPALALQTVVARDAVHGRSRESLRRTGRWCAGGVTVVAAAAVPVLSALLGIAAVTVAAAVVSAPVLVLLATEQGVLQGGSRFRELGVVLGAAGAGKVLPAVLALVLGASAGPALLASAAGSMGAVLLARLIADRRRDVATGDVVGRLRDVLAASQVQLVLVLLTSVDLLLARRVLDPEQAGIYALGAVAAKAAFWLPAAVGVVLYPRMADPRSSTAAVRSALAVLGAIGTVVVAGVAVAAPLVTVVLGAEYATAAPLLWLFAAQGALLSVVQCALLASVARGDTRPAALAWIVVIAQAAAIVVVAESPTSLVVVALCGAAVATVVTSAVALAPRRVFGSGKGVSQ